MQNLNYDIAIFGFGEITNRIIDGIVGEGLSVICVTNFAPLGSGRHTANQVSFYSREEILNVNLSCEVSLVTWRNSEILSEHSGGFYKWFSSDTFKSKKNFFLSSASVYKDSYYPLTESRENLEPGILQNSKFLLEEDLMRIMQEKNIRNCNLRIANVYGSMITQGFIGLIFRSCVTSNSVKRIIEKQIYRDYISVDDVSAAVIGLIKSNEYAEHINVSTGIPTSSDEVFESFNLSGYFLNVTEVPFLEKSIKVSVVLNCGLLSSILDWHPVPFADGISKAIINFQQGS